MVSKIKIEGAAELIRKSNKLQLDLTNENRQVFANEARILRNLIRSKAPRLTGALRDAIVIKKWKDKDGVVGYVVGITKESSRPEFSVGKAYYPASQEYGWNGHPGHPYLRPSFDSRRHRIRNNAKLAYTKVLKKAG